MAEHSKKLKYVKAAPTVVECKLYTTTGEVGSNYLAVSDGSNNPVYAKLDSNLSHADASDLRVRKGSTTYAVLKQAAAANPFTSITLPRNTRPGAVWYDSSNSRAVIIAPYTGSYSTRHDGYPADFSSATETNYTAPTYSHYQCAHGMYNGNVYVVGGDQNRNKVEKYSISGNSWSTLSTAPFYTVGCAGFATIGQYLYVLPCTNSDNYDYNYQKTLYRFDMSSETWTQLTDHPSFGSGGFKDITMVTDGTNLYTFCGVGVSLATNANLHKYTVSTGTWSVQNSSVPFNGRYWMRGAYYNGKIYALGGVANNWTAATTAYTYTIATDSWSTLSTALPIGSFFAPTLVNGSIAYIMGGYGGTTNGGSTNEMTLAVRVDLSQLT